jgi:hypothetical protein
MGSDELISEADASEMLALVATLAELPPDPLLRRRYVLAAICKLVDGAVGLAMCCSYEGPDQRLRVCSAAHVGLPGVPARQRGLHALALPTTPPIPIV